MLDSRFCAPRPVVVLVVVLRVLDRGSGSEFCFEDVRVLRPLLLPEVLLSL